MLQDMVLSRISLKNRLYQSYPALSNRQLPSGYLEDDGIRCGELFVEGTDKVCKFLQVFIDHFHTVPYICHTCDLESPPEYHVVRQLRGPGIEERATFL
jgi:hypothetical protein